VPSAINMLNSWFKKGIHIFLHAWNISARIIKKLVTVIHSGRGTC
jgi:hypothetical protein